MAHVLTYRGILSKSLYRVNAGSNDGASRASKPGTRRSYSPDRDAAATLTVRRLGTRDHLDGGALHALDFILFGLKYLKVIEPLLQWFFPTASVATITLLHALIRKAAHFTNYAILFWLLIRGPLRGRPYVALGCCVLYAMLDEGHQIFVPGRGASLYDVALDSSGALFSRFLNLAVEDVA